MKYFLLLLLITLPTVTLAQTGSLQGLIAGIGGFINDVLIPFILGIAFLIFVINAVRFFVIGGDNTESQENARNLALYGVGAFVLILSLWGMVNILANGIGLNNTAECDENRMSDYLTNNGVTPCLTLQPVVPDTIITPVVPDTVNPVIPGVINPVTSTTTVIPPITSTTTATSTVLISRGEAEDIRRATSVYFATMNDDFGEMTAAVKNTLFADLSSAHNSNITDQARAVAVARLYNANKVPLSNLESYVKAVNSSRPATAQKLELSNIINQSKLPVPLTQTVLAKQTATKNRINELLIKDIDIYGNPNNNSESRQIILSNLYSSSRTDAERLTHLNLLIRNIVTDSNSLDAVVAASIRTEFTDGINTERIFKGNYIMLE